MRWEDTAIMVCEHVVRTSYNPHGLEEFGVWNLQDAGTRKLCWSQQEKEGA